MESIFACLLVRLSCYIKETVHPSLYMSAWEPDPVSRVDDLDGVGSLVPHLQWLRRVGYVFVERIADQLLNRLVVLRITKLSDMRSLAIQILFWTHLADLLQLLARNSCQSLPDRLD